MQDKEVISTQLTQREGCFRPDSRTQNALPKNPKWPDSLSMDFYISKELSQQKALFTLSPPPAPHTGQPPPF